VLNYRGAINVETYTRITPPVIHPLIVWSRVLFEELIVAQLAKKLPAVYETRIFISIVTRTGKNVQT
jgi:hypothetical protein